MKINYIEGLCSTVVDHEYEAFDGLKFKSFRKCRNYERTLVKGTIDDVNTKSIDIIGEGKCEGYYVENQDQYDRVKNYIIAFYGLRHDIEFPEFTTEDWFFVNFIGDFNHFGNAHLFTLSQFKEKVDSIINELNT